MLSQPLLRYQRDSKETEMTKCHWPKLLEIMQRSGLDGLEGPPLPHQTQRSSKAFAMGLQNSPQEEAVH